MDPGQKGQAISLFLSSSTNEVKVKFTIYIYIIYLF